MAVGPLLCSISPRALECAAEGSEVSAEGRESGVASWRKRARASRVIGVRLSVIVRCGSGSQRNMPYRVWHNVV
jgi:hypothetical protein